MDKRIVIEFTNGRTFDNLVTKITGRPDDEVLAEIDRSISLMAARGFKPTGIRTFQRWSWLGWVRMTEKEVHEQGPKTVAGFRTSAAYIR